MIRCSAPLAALAAATLLGACDGALPGMGGSDAPASPGGETWTFEALKAEYPALDQVEFARLDSNNDGLVDRAELEADGGA